MYTLPRFRATHSQSRLASDSRMKTTDFTEFHSWRVVNSWDNRDHHKLLTFMSKHTWIALLLVATFFTAGAQLKITVGKPYEVIDSPSKFYFSENGQILTLKVDKKTVLLQKLDAKTLTFKSLKSYDDFPKDYVIERVTEFKNHYYLFYSTYEDEKEMLYSREIDFTKGEFIGKGKNVLTVSEKITGTLSVSGFYRYSVQDKYDFYFSYDSTSMVVQYRVKPDKRNDAKSFDVIGMHVYDKDLKEKWSKKSANALYGKEDGQPRLFRRCRRKRIHRDTCI